MKQIYSRKSSNFKMQPKKETIRFLLDFSKSFTVVKTESNNFIELNLN